MIDVLSKSAEEISPSDICAFVASAHPEGEQIEFKRSLPTSKGKRDPWKDRGELGDKAKTEILEEVTAFANAYGGLLLLGIEESPMTPATASAVVPVSRCNDLAERFKLIFRDCVEPQIPNLEIFAVSMSGDTGVVLFRVGRSYKAPHRVTKSLVCPIRRADRCEKMTMREIQEMTLNTFRGLDRIESRLSQRSDRFFHELDRLNVPDAAFGCRLTATPLYEDIGFERVFRHGGLVDEFKMPWRTIKLNGQPISRMFTCNPVSWKALLRGARSERKIPEVSRNNEAVLITRKIDWNFYHEIHNDGLIEFGGVHEPNWQLFHFPPPWIFTMFGNLLMWINNARKLSHSIGTEYVIEVELYLAAGRPVPVDQYWDKYWEPKSQKQKFPHYSIGEHTNINSLLAEFHRDAFHLVGEDIQENIVIAI